MTDDEFWSATDQLKLIYRWARASYVAPWALLYAVLLRAIATTGPHVMLPGPPAPASLNMGIVLVGRSGAGKGVTDKLSRTVWPADIHEEGLGSGQGVAELFKEQKDPEDRVTRALFTVSEIDHLAALNAGQGNSTRAALKAALTGDRLGSKGASIATTRAVPADSYRLGLSISAQFGHTDVLLGDVTGGTPQRLLWAPVTDPDMPDEPGPTPDRVLDTTMPPWALSGYQVLMQYGSDEIREYIKSGLLANGRGIGEAIDGHRTLARLKVGAALAILDHRTVVSAGDWDLSEVIIAKSDATRNSVLEYDRQAARAKVRDRAMARAVGEEIVDERRTDVVRRRIFKILDEGPTTHGAVHSRIGKREYKDLFPGVIASLLASGEVHSEDTQRGKRYSLGAGVKVDPGVKVETRRSDALTPRVKVDPEATVTDLDTRRSVANGGLKVSCPAWLANYVEHLRSAGHARISSLAVYEAGTAAGHSKGSIGQAVDKHPDLVVVGREGRSNIFSLTGERTGYKPCTEWVQEYFDALPADTDVVDKDAFRSDAELAGHGWDAAAQAARESGRVELDVDPGNGRKTLWRIGPREETA